jgi:hypothetical protein
MVLRTGDGLKITQHGRQSVKGPDFAKALVEVVRQSQDSGDSHSDAYMRMAVYTAARLCIDKRGAVRTSDIELSEFLRENGQVIDRAIEQSGWLKLIEQEVSGSAN